MLLQNRVRFSVPSVRARSQRRPFKTSEVKTKRLKTGEKELRSIRTAEKGITFVQEILNWGCQRAVRARQPAVGSVAYHTPGQAQLTSNHINNVCISVPAERCDWCWLQARDHLTMDSGCPQMNERCLHYNNLLISFILKCIKKYTCMRVK